MPINIPQGFWERDISHFPQPLYPLERSVTPPLVAAAFRAVFSDFSLMPEGIDVQQIGGWTYQRLIPPGGRDRAAPPTWLWWLLTRLAPPVRRRIAGCVSAVRQDLAGRWLNQWTGEWRPDLIRRIAALRSIDLTVLDDASLLRHLDATYELRRDGHLVHFRVNAAITLPLAEFAFACRDLLGWTEQQGFAMLNGLSVASSAPADALSRLASLIRPHQALCACLDRIDSTTAARMTAIDPAFGEAFNAYQDEFGVRTLRYETCDPTVAEIPEFTLGLLRDQVWQPFDPLSRAGALGEVRERTCADARRLLASRSPDESARFERVLARAQCA